MDISLYAFDKSTPSMFRHFLTVSRKPIDTKNETFYKKYKTRASEFPTCIKLNGFNIYPQWIHINDKSACFTFLSHIEHRNGKFFASRIRAKNGTDACNVQGLYEDGNITLIVYRIPDIKRYSIIFKLCYTILVSQLAYLPFLGARIMFQFDLLQTTGGLCMIYLLFILLLLKTWPVMHETRIFTEADFTKPIRLNTGRYTDCRYVFAKWSLNKCLDKKPAMVTKKDL